MSLLLHCRTYRIDRIRFFTCKPDSGRPRWRPSAGRTASTCNATRSAALDVQPAQIGQAVGWSVDGGVVGSVADALGTRDVAATVLSSALCLAAAASSGLHGLLRLPDPFAADRLLTRLTIDPAPP